MIISSQTLVDDRGKNRNLKIELSRKYYIDDIEITKENYLNYMKTLNSIHPTQPSQNTKPITCYYPNCNLEIIEEDRSLKIETAKFCEKHNKEFIKLSNNNNIEGLIKFMTKVVFK